MWEVPGLIGLGEINGPGGTEFLAGLAFAPLLEEEAVGGINGEFQGHRLRIEDVRGFARYQPLVEFVRRLFGALLGAQAAGDALGHIDITGRLVHGDGKIAWLPLDPLHLGRGQDFYMQMPPALHQLGGENAHGTVVRRKGLVQLGHDPTDGGFGFHHIDVKPGVRQVQGRLHSGNARAHHHDCAHRIGSVLLRFHRFTCKWFLLREYEEATASPRAKRRVNKSSGAQIKPAAG